VMNRLLFPFLFDAVRLLEETRLTPAAIDDCMRMGAGHPTGPLALLDYVGLDVAAAIGRSIGTQVPGGSRRWWRRARWARRPGAGSTPTRPERATVLRGRALTKCLGEIEVRLGSSRSRRTYPSSQPLLQKHFGRRSRSPETGGRMCLSVDPPQDLPLSSSTAEAIKSVRPQGSASSRLVQSATHSCDSKPLFPPHAPPFRTDWQAALIRTDSCRMVQAGTRRSSTPARARVPAQAGSCACSRMRTASMRFSRTDSTRMS